MGRLHVSRRAGAIPASACVLSFPLCALVILAAVLPAAAGGEAPADPRPSEGEFVTFARPDLGFSVRYPRAWDVWVQGPSAWEARSLGWRISFVGRAVPPLSADPFRPVIFVERFPRMGMRLQQYTAAHQEVARRDQAAYRAVAAGPVQGRGGERYLLEETYEFNGNPMRKQTLFVLDGDGVFHITAVAPEGDWGQDRRRFEVSLASFALLPR
ncbi:MAG: hypothetical protein L0214_12265 [candidate division NC10 bacterium]|nr:hypothetical protein [candidate division NC10 bacterium]